MHSCGYCQQTFANKSQLMEHHRLNKHHNTGADPGFQVRGGALKKIAPIGGRRETFWGISCEKSRFYAKKILFF
jgi:hypothetical protein